MNTQTKQKTPSVKGATIDGRKLKKLFQRTCEIWKIHTFETLKTGKHFSSQTLILQALEGVILDFDLWNEYIDFRNKETKPRPVNP